jgi:molybdopterin-guanine dinucleotide biosynthesis protein A
MGRDKATILLPNGLTLLDQALHTLKSAGARELLVSVRQGQTYDRPETHEIVDSVENCGPLAGLLAALDAAATDHVIVLAVDLPAVSPDYLRKLLAARAPNRGAVPQQGNFFEPLVAVYPRKAADSARDALSAGRFSLQMWVRELAKKGLIQPIMVEPSETGFFANWNSPDDITGSKPTNRRNLQSQSG